MNWKNIVVAGGGVLGSQIAFQIAYKGFNTTVWLRSEASIERAKPYFESLKNEYLQTLEAMKTNPEAYARGLSDKKNLTNEEIDKLKFQVENAYDNLFLTTDFEKAFGNADFVIESISEEPTAKIEFYEKIQNYIPEKTVIATNSSTMLPSIFAKYTGRPEKYLALHFANHIWRNNTAEVMGHSETEQKYYDEVVNFASNIGMIPLKLKKEQPGYILNSLLVPFLSAAEYLLANDVADPETIDKTWSLGTGAPLGPFRILDIVGLKTAYNISLMKPGADDISTPNGKIVAMLKKYIDAGKFGVASGEGFYKY